MPRLRRNDGLIGSLEASRLLKVTPQTIGGWRRRGLLKPAGVIERSDGVPYYRYRREDIEAIKQQVDYSS